MSMDDLFLIQTLHISIGSGHNSDVVSFAVRSNTSKYPGARVVHMFLLLTKQQTSLLLS